MLLTLKERGTADFCMLIKTIQWNIGGGKIRKAGDNPESGPYTNDGLAYIGGVLKKLRVDIVTLQETHADEKTVQAEILASNVGLPHVVNDIYDLSHIEDGQGLGQAILSRFAICAHSFNFFFNPRLRMQGPDGSTWISHNKGVSKCLLATEDNKTIQIATLHLLPFRKYGVDPFEKEFENLRKNIADLASPSEKMFLLQGDFNFDDASIKRFLPTLFSDNISEILQDKPTTPRGRRYDHIIYKGITHVRSKVITDVLTDHFPVYSEFEL